MKIFAVTAVLVALVSVMFSGCGGMDDGKITDATSTTHETITAETTTEKMMEKLTDEMTKVEDSISSVFAD